MLTKREMEIKENHSSTRSDNKNLYKIQLNEIEVESTENSRVTCS